MDYSATAFVSSAATSFTHNVFSPRCPRSSVRNIDARSVSSYSARKPCWTMKIGIIYSTVTSSTEKYAQMISDNLPGKETAMADVADVAPDTLGDYEALIVGAPTLQADSEDRRTGTPWDDFLVEEVKKVDLKGKPVAVFGHGDAKGYPDNFCDAIEQMHDKFQQQGSKMIGYTDAKSVDYSESKAVRDGKFLGLALDIHTDDEDCERRISDWCSQIISEASV